MNVDSPIITSLLDDDLYKATIGAVVYHNFPNATVTYEFFNRGKTHFPSGFAIQLRKQIQLLANLKYTPEEIEYLKSLNRFKDTYIEFLRHFQLDPSEVNVTQLDTGELKIFIKGAWYRTIFWEIKLMAIISELYFIMTGQPMSRDWHNRISIKAMRLSDAGCHWIDFGSRRRYSYEVQDAVVREMMNYKGFLGTSNPHLAMKYGVTPHGTFAHESVMAMSALYGPRMANKMWQKHWAEHFEGNVGVALTDTFTTDIFLQDFGSYEARLFDGVRHDSNDPFIWGEKMLNHYRKMNIPTSNKRLVFSDNLNVDKYIALDTHFRQFAQPCGGIGTHFTNDVGVKPLNMVIKMTSADFGIGPINVVKLSDDLGKHTGDARTVELVKEQLRIS